MAGEALSLIEEADRTILEAPGLRVVFSRRGDRWTHQLECQSALTDSAAPGLPVVVQSLEMNEAAPDRDPRSILSPVYQELHTHDLGPSASGGLCLLLTGHYETHHFSAAVTLAADPKNPESFRLEMDVADRCRDAVRHLAASYHVALDSGSLRDATTSTVVWDGNRLGGRLELASPEPGLVSLGEAGRGATLAQVVGQVDPKGFTHRLRYRWVWRAAAAASADLANDSLTR
jgi:hypothetical protein